MNVSDVNRISIDDDPAMTAVPIWQQAVALAVGPGTAIGFDVYQWLHLPISQRTWAILLFATTSGIYLAWLALLPICLLFGQWRPLGGSRWRLSDRTRSAVCFLVCSAAGIATAAGFGWGAHDLPPLYHDEYSYLFQARTFLSGRLHFPPHELASSFDQVHVLNEGVFASRYFPGAGIWIAPFLAWDSPIWSGWLAVGLTAGFVSLAARRFSAVAGYSAGLLVAMSPAMVVFGNLLLATGPTMLWFSVFLWAFWGMFERRSAFWAVLAGLAIGMAFLTRPLTAVGLGSPFALYCFFRYWRHRVAGYRGKFVAVCASFGLCAAALGLYNISLTGRPLKTAYGVYTAQKTPSHAYGFYNQQRGVAHRGPNTDLAYDSWAEDLTPARALSLVGARCWRLLQWSAGFIASAAFGSLALLQLSRLGDRGMLMCLSILGLIAAYAPYGFPGIFAWSYLVEATPVLLLLAGVVVARLCSDWTRRGRPMVGFWWLMLAGLAAGQQLFGTIPDMWNPASEFVYPRQRAQRQRQLEDDACESGPILVLFDVDPKHSLHSTFVHNRPELSGPVVRAWLPTSEEKLRQLTAAFPDRTVYLYRFRGDRQPAQWRRVPRRGGASEDKREPSR